MKIFSQVLTVLFSLTLLITLGASGYFAFAYIAGLFAKIDSQVAVVTAIASVIVLAAAWIIATSISEAGKHNKAQQVHAEKVATYQQLIEAWKGVLQHEWSPELESLDRQLEDLQACECLLVLYGSPGVVKAYGALQALATGLDPQRPELVAQFATVLVEMRQDLGADMQGLKTEDLLQLLYVEAKNSSERPKAQPYHDHRPSVSLTPNA